MCDCDARIREANRRVEVLSDAILSLLNIEFAALLGGESESMRGLDVEWHFAKARKALKDAGRIVWETI